MFRRRRDRPPTHVSLTYMGIGLILFGLIQAGIGFNALSSGKSMNSSLPMHDRHGRSYSATVGDRFTEAGAVAGIGGVLLVGCTIYRVGRPS